MLERVFLAVGFRREGRFHVAIVFPEGHALKVRGAVPEFPLDTLSEFLANYVSASAEATQTPPDLTAMLTISICGAALAKHFRVTDVNKPVDLLKR